MVAPPRLRQALPGFLPVAGERFDAAADQAAAFPRRVASPAAGWRPACRPGKPAVTEYRVTARPEVGLRGHPARRVPPDRRAPRRHRTCAGRRNVAPPPPARRQVPAASTSARRAPKAAPPRGATSARGREAPSGAREAAPGAERTRSRREADRTPFSRSGMRPIRHCVPPTPIRRVLPSGRSGLPSRVGGGRAAARAPTSPAGTGRSTACGPRRRSAPPAVLARPPGPGGIRPVRARKHCGSRPPSRTIMVKVGEEASAVSGANRAHRRPCRDKYVTKPSY